MMRIIMITRAQFELGYTSHGGGKTFPSQSYSIFATLKTGELLVNEPDGDYYIPILDAKENLIAPVYCPGNLRHAMTSSQKRIFRSRVSDDDWGQV